MRGRTVTVAPAWPYTLVRMRLIALALGFWMGGAAGQAERHDLGAGRVDVLVFTSIDCPLSNRYAPELRRLHERFASEAVRFRLVFANPHDLPDAIRDHVKAFGYRMDVLDDRHQDLVRLTKATVTPEAAVFDRQGRLVYRGRIDDRYVDLGIDRQTPTTHDLEDAVAATLAGRPVANPTTRAVGCFLADFAR